jgi:hypothetical protein
MNKSIIYCFVVGTTTIALVPLQVQAVTISSDTTDASISAFWGEYGNNIQQGSGGGGGTSVIEANAPSPFTCRGGYRLVKHPKFGTVSKEYC